MPEKSSDGFVHYILVTNDTGSYVMTLSNVGFLNLKSFFSDFVLFYSDGKKRVKTLEAFKNIVIRNLSASPTHRCKLER